MSLSVAWTEPDTAPYTNETENCNVLKEAWRVKIKKYDIFLNFEDILIRVITVVLKFRPIDRLVFAKLIYYQSSSF